MEVFIVIHGTTVGVVVNIFRTQEEATSKAEESADLTAITGAKTWEQGQALGVAYYDGTDILDERPLSDAQEILNKRRYLIDLLRKAEGIGGKLAVWHAARQDNILGSEVAGVNESLRSRSYGRWVEANTRAMLVDANLSGVGQFALLEAECLIDPETWYWLHKVEGSVQDGGWYAIYSNNDRSGWNWHYTIGATVTSNSRVGTPSSVFSVTLDATEDWVKALQ